MRQGRAPGYIAVMPARLVDRWPLVALVVSAAVLAIAHAFETFGHLAPCELCLKEREMWWTALALAALGVLAGFTPLALRGRRIAAIALTLAFLYGAGLAAYHAGAEWKFWPGPASCSGGATSVSLADLRAFSRGVKMTLPSCDKPAWVFLGVSMAGWNALISLAMAAASGAAALRRRPA
ncbi:MAG: disulfide bond formation protein B [Caulobacteraceae bacterium]